MAVKKTSTSTKKPAVKAKKSDKSKAPKIFEKGLTRPIQFNGKTIKKLRAELDHINYGLKTDNLGGKKLSTKKRTNFSLNDIEKFIRMLDGEYLCPVRYEGKDCVFNAKIECPVLGDFHGRYFLMIFKTFHSNEELIHTITLFPNK